MRLGGVRSVTQYRPCFTANGKAPLFPDDPGIVGIAADVMLQTMLPVAHIDDIPAIAAMMQRAAIPIEEVLARSAGAGDV